MENRDEHRHRLGSYNSCLSYRCRPLLLACQGPSPGVLNQLIIQVFILIGPDRLTLSDMVFNDLNISLIYGINNTFPWRIDRFSGAFSGKFDHFRIFSYFEYQVEQGPGIVVNQKAIDLMII